MTSCRKKEEPCPDPFADKVKCDECKHWIDRSDAQIIDTHTGFGSYTRCFCPMHRKPYTRVHNYTELVYFAELRVNEDGTPYGYVKENVGGGGTATGETFTIER